MWAATHTASVQFALSVAELNVEKLSELHGDDTDSSHQEEEEEEDYKLWPANKSDRSWQSLSNPAKRHSFVSN